MRRKRSFKVTVTRFFKQIQKAVFFVNVRTLDEAHDAADIFIKDEVNRDNLVFMPMGDELAPEMEFMISSKVLVPKEAQNYSGTVIRFPHYLAVWMKSQLESMRKYARETSDISHGDKVQMVRRYNAVIALLNEGLEEERVVKAYGRNKK